MRRSMSGEQRWFGLSPRCARAGHVQRPSSPTPCRHRRTTVPKNVASRASLNRFLLSAATAPDDASHASTVSWAAAS